MANFEREVYELFKLLTRPGDKHDKKVNDILLFESQAGPRASSQFWLPISWFLVKYHSEMKCFFVQ